MSGSPVAPDAPLRPQPPPPRSARRPGPGAAVAAASAHYLRGEPIDMSALAAELGVGRATLYRWVGSRERLLAAVLAEMAERTFRVAVRDVGGAGPERIVAVLDRFMRAVVDAAPLAAFTAREPRLFVRLATMPGAAEDRATDLIAREVQAEIDRGELRAPLPPRALAEAIVRVADSFMYTHYLGGRRPEIERAIEVVELMLRPLGRAGPGSPGISRRPWTVLL
ncbi:QsdR family transcriptional regulator [Actinomadura chibensis]|uniref:QsdR family transcriptional regulator n=1 Tax=Actinomadura chibensis TaxID=392828 RepID=UPI0008323261|nr:QsdR family transcriptional regulator [Actinomadura chibensis]